VCRQLVGFAGSFGGALYVPETSCVAADISLMAGSDPCRSSVRCRLKPSWLRVASWLASLA